MHPIQLGASIDDDTEPKHLKAELRRRLFDDRRQYGALGATRKRSDMYYRNRAWGLEINRPRNSDFAEMTTEVDEICNIPPLRHNTYQPDQLCELRDALGEEYAAHESYNKCGQNVTTFRIPGNGWMDDERTAALQKAHVDRLQLAIGGAWEGPSANNQYEQTKACKVVGRVRDAPLDWITDPSLLDKHTLSCSASQRGTFPESARVHNNTSACCWVPPAEDIQRHFLQVDLHVDCEVTYISSQGRYPTMLQYRSTCKFTGAQVMDEQHENMRQWVWKYEVLARVSGGRTWFSLGSFDGNRDMTTEVAHKLLTPVKCRYLRFKVLGFDRMAAMRVGIYGSRPGGVAQKTHVEQQMVEYRFFRIDEGRSNDVVPVGSQAAARWQYHCPYCPHYFEGPCRCKKRQRHLRRLAACKSLREEDVIARLAPLRTNGAVALQPTEDANANLSPPCVADFISAMLSARSNAVNSVSTLSVGNAASVDHGAADDEWVVV